MNGKSDEKVVVYVKDLCFSYSNSDSILNKINLKINNSTIYGLLGPSGCGKTTLLKCILGRLKSNRGKIEIFGTEPGSPESNIPGAGVGYMPQEFGLYMEFTIEEILTYFGKIYSMNKNEVKNKFKELEVLLKLPQNNKLIGKLSGGQKRRVSLACALIHSPPLLILDEPTVGTDPILRKTILSYLKSLCESGVTVILTTHYVEESRNANIVAFMRNGRILAEDEPNVLLEKYVSTNLEEVFLKICESQNYSFEKNLNIENKSNDSLIGPKANTKNGLKNNLMISDKCSFKYITDEIMYLKNESKVNVETYIQTIHMKKTKFFGKISALLHKNIKRLFRSYILLVLFILMPATVLGLAMSCIGNGPTNIEIAIFNEEIINSLSESWGQVFTNSIDKEIFNLHEFDSFEKAMDSVESGQTYALIDINDRFTKAFRLRHIYGTDVDNDTLEESQIRVYIDRSNQLVALQIERYLYEAILKFAQEIALKTNVNPESIKIPLTFEQPVYGVRDGKLIDFALPGLFIVMAFFGTSTVSCNMIIEERKEGILERSLVAGMTTFDFILSHALTQTLLVCVQIMLFLPVPYLIFGKQLDGSLILLILLLISQGLCGVSFGLMVSSTSSFLFALLNQFMALMTCVILGGVFWPLENIPPTYQLITKFMPTTLPMLSIRSILYRGWTIGYYDVYIGFVVSYVWFVLFFMIALIVSRKSN